VESEQPQKKRMGRPPGPETPESILKYELRKNRELMEKVRRRLEEQIPTTADPEVLAKIIDTLSKANATTLKIIETAAARETPEKDVPMDEGQLVEFLKTGKLG
jgi:ABC-type arginine transport system ATPase subunit